MRQPSVAIYIVLQSVTSIHSFRNVVFVQFQFKPNLPLGGRIVLVITILFTCNCIYVQINPIYLLKISLFLKIKKLQICFNSKYMNIDLDCWPNLPAGARLSIIKIMPFSLYFHHKIVKPKLLLSVTSLTCCCWLPVS